MRTIAINIQILPTLSPRKRGWGRVLLSLLLVGPRKRGCGRVCFYVARRLLSLLLVGPSDTIDP
jgi:hypothetical protein